MIAGCAFTWDKIKMKASSHFNRAVAQNAPSSYRLAIVIKLMNMNEN